MKESMSVAEAFAQASDLDALVAEVAQNFPDGSASWINIGHVQRMLRATEGHATCRNN